MLPTAVGTALRAGRRGGEALRAEGTARNIVMIHIRVAISGTEPDGGRDVIVQEASSERCDIRPVAQSSSGVESRRHGPSSRALGTCFFLGMLRREIVTGGAGTGKRAEIKVTTLCDKLSTALSARRIARRCRRSTHAKEGCRRTAGDPLRRCFHTRSNHACPMRRTTRESSEIFRKVAVGLRYCAECPRSVTSAPCWSDILISHRDLHRRVSYRRSGTIMRTRPFLATLCPTLVSSPLPLRPPSRNTLQHNTVLCVEPVQTCTTSLTGNVLPAGLVHR
jgi:hypothetical protein